MIFLAFVVPLAIYFLILAYLNRSRHPVMVSGPWDFAGILFAASGFLILGGPAILTGLHEQWRLSWLLGHTRFLSGVGTNWYFWVGLWALYFVALVTGAAYLLWTRRKQTSIYNIEPAAFDEVLALMLDRCGYDWLRGRTGRIFLRPREGGVTGNLGVSAEPVKPQAAYGPDSGHGLTGGPRQRGTLALSEKSSPEVYLAGIDVEYFAALRHVTLHWVGEVEWFRPEFEAELARTLAQVRSRANPASVWFLFLSLSLFALSFLGLLAVVALRIIYLMR